MKCPSQCCTHPLTDLLTQTQAFSSESSSNENQWYQWELFELLHHCSTTDQLRYWKILPFTCFNVATSFKIQASEYRSKLIGPNVKQADLSYSILRIDCNLISMYMCVYNKEIKRVCECVCVKRRDVWIQNLLLLCHTRTEKWTVPPISGLPTFDAHLLLSDLL